MTLTCLNKTEKPYKRKFLKKLKRVTTNIEAKKNLQDLETTRRSYATRRLKMAHFAPNNAPFHAQIIEKILNGIYLLGC